MTLRICDILKIIIVMQLSYVSSLGSRKEFLESFSLNLVAQLPLELDWIFNYNSGQIIRCRKGQEIEIFSNLIPYVSS